MLAAPPLALAVTVALAAWSPGVPEYQIDGQRVLRIDGDRWQPLACTLAGGTGAVRAVARAESGHVYVAAEHGLFVGHDDLEHLDPLPLWQGAPRGAPIGLLLEDQRRLWLATEDQFGCVDLRHFFGRTFTSLDGLPPPPYRSLSRAPSGAIVLEAEGATFHYRPGGEGAPECRVVALGGRTYEPGRRVALDGGELELAVEARASGGAVLRWRELFHPNWNRIEGHPPAIAGLEPGRHELLLAAFDRDLALSVPVQLAVDVPYPGVLRPSRLVPLAAAAGLAVLAAFAAGAWRRGADRRGWIEALASAGLVLLFAGQLLAAIFPHARGWPLVGFDMYTQSAAPFAHTYGDAVQGFTPAGERLWIRPWGAAFGPFELRRLVAPAVDGTPAQRAAVLGDLERLMGGVELAGFEVLVERFRLTERGPIRVAPLLMCRCEREADGAAR